MKNVRFALWRIFEQSKAEITPEIETLLFGQLGVLGKQKTIAVLHIWRPIALELAQIKSTRDRHRLVHEYAAEKPYWLLYATVAWAARTLALAEYLDRADSAAQYKAHAGVQALMLMDKFEDDETWLWPFESEPPWRDDFDDDAD